MNRSLAAEAQVGTAGTGRRTWAGRIVRRAFRARLAKIREGQILLSDGGADEAFGASTQFLPTPVHVTIRDPLFWREIARGGVVGAAEAWIRGYWTCDDLTLLVRILLRNRHVLEDINAGVSVWRAALRRLRHLANRNSRTGSRRNIAAHYDLGNEFYAVWLDRTMMYSCAWFERPEMSLEAASVAKLDLVCRKLELGPGDDVLEIGSGWGGFALHAARNYGCRVTTVTLSQRQYDYVVERARATGLADRVAVQLCDYRDLQGRYDKIVSIEMIEAVGWENQARFFRKCDELLRPHGQMLLQAITIADQNFTRYRRGVDFIQRYVFPGGCLTSVSAMLGLLTAHTDMRVVHLDDLGPHYARTLAEWRTNFDSRIDAVRALGYSEKFIRLWRYYFSYCEAAFQERAIGDVQMLLVKPGARVRPPGFRHEESSVVRGD